MPWNEQLNDFTFNYKKKILFSSNVSSEVSDVVLTNIRQLGTDLMSLPSSFHQKALSKKLPQC